MSFDNLLFWPLFICLFLIYWPLNVKWRKILLLAFSLLFYGFWGLEYVLILLISTGLDYAMAHLMLRCPEQSRARRWILISSVVMNLSFLIGFKYLIPGLPSGVRAGSWLETAYLIGLPVGISFYSFQAISFMVDFYRGKVKLPTNYAGFLLYISFFPQMVAGPIEKARELLPQFDIRHQFSWFHFEQGIYLILWGLFKKIYVSNALKYPIDSYFMQSQGTDVFSALYVFFLVTFKIYADFSGYSDIARGLGRVLGFRIAINFRPFWKARNPSEFWLCWNVSLTKWIQEYFLIPISSKNESHFMRDLKIIFSMAIIGLWHAMGWNWLLFGLFNGFVIVAYRIAQRNNFFTVQIGYLLLLLLIFGNGLFHNHQSTGQLTRVWSDLQTFAGFSSVKDLFFYSLPYLAPVFITETLLHFDRPMEETIIESRWVKLAFGVMVTTGIIVLQRTQTLGFDYFAF